jgi:hypothetical protein
MKPIIVAPSILSADLRRLGEEVHAIALNVTEIALSPEQTASRPSEARG